MGRATTAIRLRHETRRSCRMSQSAKASKWRVAAPPAPAELAVAARTSLRYPGLPRRCAANAASDTFRKADNPKRTERTALRLSAPKRLRRRKVRLAPFSSGEYPAFVLERLELQRVAAGIADEEGCLFAGQSCKTCIGSNRKFNFALLQPIDQSVPLGRRKNHAEMTYRHLFAVNLIKRFIGNAIRG